MRIIWIQPETTFTTNAVAQKVVILIRTIYWSCSPCQSFVEFLDSFIFVFCTAECFQHYAPRQQHVNNNSICLYCKISSTCLYAYGQITNKHKHLLNFDYKFFCLRVSQPLKHIDTTNLYYSSYIKKKHTNDTFWDTDNSELVPTLMCICLWSAFEPMLEHFPTSLHPHHQHHQHR